MLGGISEALGDLLGRTGRAPASIPAAAAENATSRRPSTAYPYMPVTRRGQAIARPVSATDIVPRFLIWMVERDLIGEFLWRDVWSYYADWFCSEEKLVPLPVGMKAKFAEVLAEHCHRDQVRVWEDGRKRRLTTYRIAAHEVVQQLRVVTA